MNPTSPNTAPIGGQVRPDPSQTGAVTDDPDSAVSGSNQIDQLWTNGDWAGILTLELEQPPLFAGNASAMVLLAIANLQVGKLNKARHLIDKAVHLGCDKDLVKTALLAASIEKLSSAAKIQRPGELQQDSAVRAAALRQSVLQAIQLSRQTQTRPLPPPAPTPQSLILPTAAIGRAAECGASDGSPRTLRIGILSGYYPGVRFNSAFNHRLYAHRHGYQYIFDSGPRFDPRTYMRKLEAVQEYLDLFDWLFWIDDDAYFTHFETPLETFIQASPETEFIVCKSPSTKEIFTRISSGQFLLKNTPRAKQFVMDALQVDLKQVQKWWHKGLGMFTKGDQDALVYLTETVHRYQQPFMQILDHNSFNNRDFEYQNSLDEHFLVHFTGNNKMRDKAAFCARLSCNEYICPPGEIDKLALR